MKPIADIQEICRVEMWLVELQRIYECEAITQQEDTKQVYLTKAQEIKDYLAKR